MESLQIGVSKTANIISQNQQSDNCNKLQMKIQKLKNDTAYITQPKTRKSDERSPLTLWRCIIP